MIVVNRAAAAPRLPRRQSNTDGKPNSCGSSPTTRGRATDSGRRVEAMIAPNTIPHRCGRRAPRLQWLPPPSQLAARGPRAAARRPPRGWAGVGTKTASFSGKRPRRPPRAIGCRVGRVERAARRPGTARGGQEGARGPFSLSVLFLVSVGSPRVRSCATAGGRERPAGESARRASAPGGRARPAFTSAPQCGVEVKAGCARPHLYRAVTAAVTAGRDRRVCWRHRRGRRGGGPTPPPPTSVGQGRAGPKQRSRVWARRPQTAQWCLPAVAAGCRRGPTDATSRLLPHP